MLKYNYIFQIKYTEAILSNSTRKLLWFEITKVDKKAGQAGTQSAVSSQCTA